MAKWPFLAVLVNFHFWPLFLGYVWQFFLATFSHFFFVNKEADFDRLKNVQPLLKIKVVCNNSSHFYGNWKIIFQGFLPFSPFGIFTILLWLSHFRPFLCAYFCQKNVKNKPRNCSHDYGTTSYPKRWQLTYRGLLDQARLLDKDGMKIVSKICHDNQPSTAPPPPALPKAPGVRFCMSPGGFLGAGSCRRWGSWGVLAGFQNSQKKDKKKHSEHQCAQNTSSPFKWQDRYRKHSNRPRASEAKCPGAPRPVVWGCFSRNSATDFSPHL